MSWERISELVTAAPAWRRAVADARRRGRDAPDVLLVSCDGGFVPRWRQDLGEQSFGQWLRTRLGSRRLLASTHPLVQPQDGSGDILAIADEPARSILFTDDGFPVRPGPHPVGAGSRADGQWSLDRPAHAKPGPVRLRENHDRPGGDGTHADDQAR